MSFVKVKQNWYAGDCYEKNLCEVQSLTKIAPSEFFGHWVYKCTEMGRGYGGEPIEEKGYVSYCMKIEFDIDKYDELYLLIDFPRGTHFAGGGGKFIRGIFKSIKDAQTKMNQLKIHKNADLHSYKIHEFIRYDNYYYESCKPIIDHPKNNENTDRYEGLFVAAFIGVIGMCAMIVLSSKQKN